MASEEQPFNFVYVSGEGATLEPGRWTQLYGRVNGETEAALAGMRKANPLLRALSVRPALVDPGTHDAIHPYLPGLTNHRGHARGAHAFGPAHENAHTWFAQPHARHRAGVHAVGYGETRGSVGGHEGRPDGG